MQKFLTYGDPSSNVGVRQSDHSMLTYLLHGAEIFLTSHLVLS